MAKICPTCGQPVPEGGPGQAPAAPAPSDTPQAKPAKKFPVVMVGGACAAVVVLLIGGYLAFGAKKPLADRLYSEQQDVRDAALGELANVEVVDRALIIEGLVANLGGTDVRKRNCALDALLRLKLPADDARPVLAALQAIMRGPESPAAMQALAASRYVAPRSPDIQAACMEVLKSQGSRLSSTEFLAVLGGVAQSMSTTGDAVAGLPATLASLALTTADPTVRMSALGIVALMSATAQAEAGTMVASAAFSSTTILQGLQDPVPASRAALLAALMKVVPKPAELAPQFILLSKNESPVLRATAAEALMSSTPTSAASWVAATALLKDPVVDVRKATVVAMKPRSKDLSKMAVTGLIALLKDKDEGIREDAAMALQPLASARVKQALSAYSKAKAAAEIGSDEAAATGAPAGEAVPGEAAAAAPAETSTTTGTPIPAIPTEKPAAPATGEAPLDEGTAAPAAAKPAPAEGTPSAGEAPPAPADEAPAATKAPPADEAAPAAAKPAAAATPCGSTAEKAMALAKEHTPRSFSGDCKQALEYSVALKAGETCIFEVTATCAGEKIGTCEVEGDTGTYFWSH